MRRVGALDGSPSPGEPSADSLSAYAGFDGVLARP
jgi:hypothetical protein